MTLPHDPGCPRSHHTSAAKRCSDAVNLHLSAIGFDAVKKWVAVKLSDGSSDGILYDSQRLAAIHHRNAGDRYCYIPVRPSGLSVCQAESVMATNRMFHNAGFRLGDPDDRSANLSVIPRLTREEQVRQVSALLGK